MRDRDHILALPGAVDEVAAAFVVGGAIPGGYVGAHLQAAALCTRLRRDPRRCDDNGDRFPPLGLRMVCAPASSAAGGIHMIVVLDQAGRDVTGMKPYLPFARKDKPMPCALWSMRTPAFASADVRAAVSCLGSIRKFVVARCWPRVLGCYREER